MQKFLSLYLCIHALHRPEQSSYKLGGTKGKMGLHQFPFDLGLYIFRAVEIKISPLRISTSPCSLRAWETRRCTVKSRRAWLSVRPPAQQARGLGFKAQHHTPPAKKIKVSSYIRVPAWVKTGFAPGHWPILKGQKPLITPWRGSNPA